MTYDVWAVGDAYERYVGRWSRRVAASFVQRLAMPSGQRWVDVGCGTGALAQTVMATASPAMVVGLDPSASFLSTARSRLADAHFVAADARVLPLRDDSADVVVSGLAINFVPEPGRAAAEFARVTRPGGAVAAYVWDYAEGMLMMRHFWDAAAELDPVTAQDEGRRFPICAPDPLAALWTVAGLGNVTVDAITVPTVFADFDDYWSPFLGGQGPAPAYTMSLPGEHRDSLRESIRARLPIAADGSISLTARAWVVSGVAP